MERIKVQIETFSIFINRAISISLPFPPLPRPRSFIDRLILLDFHEHVSRSVTLEK